MSFKKYRDLILGGATLVLSAGYLIYANQIKTRTKLVPNFASGKVMPVILGVLLAVLSVLCISQDIINLRTCQQEPETKKLI